MQVPASPSTKEKKDLRDFGTCFQLWRGGTQQPQVNHLPSLSPSSESPLSEDIPSYTGDISVVQPVTPVTTISPSSAYPSHPSTQTLNTTALFTPASLAKIKRESCSQPNFATNLVRSAFSVDERKISNVRGIGKKQLNPGIVERIKDATFQQYPLETGEKVKQAWAVCVRAIVESGRRLRRV